MDSLQSARLPPVNLILRDTLKARLASLAGAGEGGLASPVGAAPVLALSLTEFDDVRYLLTAEAASPSAVELSIALPCDPSGQQGAAALPAGAAEAARDCYAAYAQLAPQPAAGYHLTLRVELARVPADAEARHAEAERLASLRSVVQGAPLRALLAPLAAGQPGSDALVTVTHRRAARGVRGAGSRRTHPSLPPRPGEAFFAKRSDAEAVTVVYPVRFKDSADAVLARSFLVQFAEARRQQHLSTAPSCSYSPQPPLELRGAPAALAEGANGGYVSLVVYSRHVCGGGRRLESALWSLNTFYAFIAFHIKCSKAYMHSSMRRRTGSLLQVLNRAKPEVEKEKKTASGRTFKQR